MLRDTGQFFVRTATEAAHGFMWLVSLCYDYALAPTGHFFAFLGTQTAHGFLWLVLHFYDYALTPVGHFFTFLGTGTARGTLWLVLHFYEYGLTPFGHGCMWLLLFAWEHVVLWLIHFLLSEELAKVAVSAILLEIAVLPVLRRARRARK